MNWKGDEPVEPKPKESLLECLACSDRFPTNAFAWLPPKSLVGKLDLLKMFPADVLASPSGLFVAECGVGAVSVILNAPNGLVVTGLCLWAVSKTPNGPVIAGLGPGVVWDKLNRPNGLVIAGLGTGAVAGALDKLNGISVSRLGVGAAPAILSTPNGLSAANLVLGTVPAILNTPDGSAVANLGVVAEPAILNGLFVVGFDVGALSGILSMPNWLAIDGLGLEAVSSILGTLNGLFFAGLGVGAVPKSIGRVEAPEVLGFCSDIPSVQGTPKRETLLVWLLLDVVKILLGDMLVVFGLAAGALGTARVPGPPNRLIVASMVVMAFLASVAASGKPMVLNVVAVLLLASLAVFDVVVAVLAIPSPTEFSPRDRGFGLLGRAAVIPPTGL